MITDNALQADLIEVCRALIWAYEGTPSLELIGSAYRLAKETLEKVEAAPQ